MMGRCAVCRRLAGKLERATYLNAPDGGVPVHGLCIKSFFE
jgi:hypothetical protein